MAQHGETRIYILKAELKMGSNQNVKNLKCWALTWLCASWMYELKNVVKSKPKFCKKLEENINKNEMGIE